MKISNVGLRDVNLTLTSFQAPCFIDFINGGQHNIEEYGPKKQTSSALIETQFGLESKPNTRFAPLKNFNLSGIFKYILLARHQVKANVNQTAAPIFFNVIVPPCCQSHMYQANISTQVVPLLLCSEQPTQSCPYHICSCWPFSKLNGLERLPRISSGDP